MRHTDEQYLEWLKQGDFLLLKNSYEKALQHGSKDFKIHRSGFEDSPNFRAHISQFALENGLSFIEKSDFFIFHIP